MLLIQSNRKRYSLMWAVAIVIVSILSSPAAFAAEVVTASENVGVSCDLADQDALTETLVKAVATGDLDAVKDLLAEGADPNRRGKMNLSPLHAARIRGFEQIAEYLISEGADADSPMPTLEEFLGARLGQATDGDSPGVAVLVSKGGKVIFKEGFGLASLEHHVPATPQTKFRIGSVTKQFTAAAILKLQEEDKLSVDDTLDEHISDFPRGDEVTLRHLLTHTSGIRSYTDKPGFMESVTKSIEPDDLIDSFKSDKFDFDPGGGWHYCNSGYFLLGRIVEKVSGQPFDEFLKEQLFEPLAMNDTGIHHWRDILPHEATGYSVEDGNVHKALDWDMSQAGGAGALYSTVEDLNRWNEAVFGGKVLSEESLKAAFTPVELEEVTRGMSYGYGWVIGRQRGLKQIQHGGGLHGFVSSLARYPDQDLTVVVLVNASPPPAGLSPGSVSQEIAEFVLWEKMEPREVLVADKDVDPEELQAYVGRYDYGGAILTVTRDDKRLFAQLTGQPKFEIFKRGEDEFFWKVVEAHVKFEKDEEGNVVRGIHQQNGGTIRAARLEDFEQVEVKPEILKRYVGKYDYGGATMIVTRKGDRLFAQLTGQPKLEIFAKNENEFFWKAASAQVKFEIDDDGKVTKAIHRQGGRTIEAPRKQ